MNPSTWSLFASIATAFGLPIALIVALSTLIQYRHQRRGFYEQQYLALFTGYMESRTSLREKLPQINQTLTVEQIDTLRKEALLLTSNLRVLTNFRRLSGSRAFSDIALFANDTEYLSALINPAIAQIRSEGPDFITNFSLPALVNLAPEEDDKLFFEKKHEEALNYVKGGGDDGLFFGNMLLEIGDRVAQINLKGGFKNDGGAERALEISDLRMRQVRIMERTNDLQMLSADLELVQADIAEDLGRTSRRLLIATLSGSRGRKVRHAEKAMRQFFANLRTVGNKHPGT
jgi:hypothetical protein